MSSGVSPGEADSTRLTRTENTFGSSRHAPARARRNRLAERLRAPVPDWGGNGAVVCSSDRTAPEGGPSFDAQEIGAFRTPSPRMDGAALPRGERLPGQAGHRSRGSPTRLVPLDRPECGRGAGGAVVQRSPGGTRAGGRGSLVARSSAEPGPRIPGGG